MARIPARTKSCHWWTHFKKMSYNNAQLARVYLHAYQITGDGFYKRITAEIGVAGARYVPPQAAKK